MQRNEIPTFAPRPRTIELERWMVHCKNAVSQYMLRTAHLERIQDIVREQMVYRLDAYLASRRETIEFPADWWQGFKLRFFPKWLLRWFPAETKEFNARHVLPTVEIPPQMRVLEFYTWDDEGVSYSKKVVGP